MPWLLMPWCCKAPGHQQPCCWQVIAIFRFPHQIGSLNMLTCWSFLLSAARAGHELQDYMKRNNVSPMKNMLMPMVQVSWSRESLWKVFKKGKKISRYVMSQDVTPVLMHWSDVFLVLTHWDGLTNVLSFIKEISYLERNSLSWDEAQPVNYRQVSNISRTFVGN